MQIRRPRLSDQIKFWTDGMLACSSYNKLPSASFLLPLIESNLQEMSIGSVQVSHSLMSNSLQPHESQHSRPPCPSPTPGVYSNSCPSNWWCHPAISSSVVPFSSCPQSLPASGSFPMSQLFTWGGHSIGVSASASVLPMNTQNWCISILYLFFSLRLTSLSITVSRFIYLIKTDSNSLLFISS